MILFVMFNIPVLSKPLQKISKALTFHELRKQPCFQLYVDAFFSCGKHYSILHQDFEVLSYTTYFHFILLHLHYAYLLATG